MYVSESRIDPSDAKGVMAKLVASAKTRNADLAISGALLFTGTHFAKILEGPPSSIALMMTALQNDPRHSNICIAAHYPISTRIFSGWQLAYHGPSKYVAQHVNRLLSRNSLSDQNRVNEQLTQLVVEFLNPMRCR